ncbi:MAG: PD-(D/E)XK nuclease family protein, partial [Pseudomonadota bacterium]|nr:PD-(D/E)XK nuclease family protein [Pseudomonadota bacterium]
MYEQHFAEIKKGATLVAANKRLARSVSFALKQKLKVSQEVWESPQILSWDAWLKSLWQTSQLLEGRAKQFTLLSETEVKLLWQRTLNNPKDNDLSNSDMAGLAASAWRKICQYKVVDANEWTDQGLTEDQQSFIRWRDAFRKTCSNENWIDDSQLLELLVEDIRAGLFKDLNIAFAGFNAWTPLQLDLKEALGKQGCTVAVINPPQPKGLAQAFECINKDDELTQAASWAWSESQANPNLSVGVVVPDLKARASEVRRRFMDVFKPDWRSGETSKPPVNLSYGESLSIKPRVASAINLMQLIEGEQSYEVFSLALRTPFLMGGRDEAGARAQLDLKLRKKLGAVFNVTDAQRFSSDETKVFSEVLEQIKLKHTDLKNRDLKSWSEWIFDLLNNAGWPGSDPLDSAAFQELEKWKNLLEDFASSAQIYGEVSWSTAFNLLQQIVQQQLHQPEGSSEAIQIMDLAESAGHEFDRLWVMGMSSIEFPEPINLHPFIPIVLQKRCGMPKCSAMENLASAEDAIERLKYSANEVIFSWAGEMDGKKSFASQLIQHSSIRAIDENPAEKVKISAQKQCSSRAPIEIIKEDKPNTWSNEMTVPGGHKVFNAQRECPLRAFLEFRLGAQQIDIPEVGLSALERGNFIHQIMERFYKDHSSSQKLMALSQDEIVQKLEAICQKEMENVPGVKKVSFERKKVPFKNKVVELEVKRILPILLEFVKNDQSRDDFTIKYIETEQIISIGNIQVKVRPDRVDEITDTKQIVVIDYKTGNPDNIKKTK